MTFSNEKCKPEVSIDQALVKRAWDLIFQAIVEVKKGKDPLSICKKYGQIISEDIKLRSIGDIGERFISAIISAAPNSSRELLTEIFQNLMESGSQENPKPQKAQQPKKSKGDRKRGQVQVSDFKRVNDAADIKKVALSFGLKIKGKSLQCPNYKAHAHKDKNPSAQLFKHSWKCFSCGEYGSVIDLAMLAGGLNPHEALLYVANISGIEIEDKKPLNMSSPRMTGLHRSSDGTQSVNDWNRPLRGKNASVYAQTSPSSQKKLQEEGILERRASSLSSRGYQPPSGDAASLMRAISDALKPISRFSRSGFEWLKSRSINKNAALKMGCHDLWPSRQTLKRIINSADDQKLIDAGLAKVVDENLRLWRPLYGAKMNDPRWRGLLVPLYWPGISWPISWRWRAYQPTEAIKKVMVPFGRSPDFLGLNSLQGARRLIIVEGEPDWLTLAGANLPDMALVGVVKFSSKPNLTWLEEHLNHLNHITIAVHDIGVSGSKGESFSLEVMTAMKLHGCSIDQLKRCYVKQNHDINDIAKIGDLDEWIKENLR